MVSVDPKHSDGLGPLSRHDFATKIDQADDLITRCIQHGSEKGAAILWPELAAQNTTELFMGLDRKHGHPVAIHRTEPERHGRPTAIGTNFDNAAISCLA